jgi:nucleoside-diphosphate-sugar epimerase
MQHHVVLGAGQIGSALASQLASTGNKVTSVRRSAAATNTDSTVRHVRVDVMQAAATRTAVPSANVIYHVMNPPYHLWHKQLLPLTESVIALAEATGARLVVLDNLYMFGAMAGAPMREDSAQNPCSRKGALRKQMFELYMQAHAAGRIRVSIARASDFFGPGIHEAHIGARYFKAAFGGSPVDVLGDPTIPHAFTYSDDVIQALATLGRESRGDGRAWHIPTLTAQPVTALSAALAKQLDIQIRERVMPSWLLTGLGVFVPALRELKEMRYQWEAPYAVDSSEMETTFALRPTPFEAQVRATADWARRSFAK